MDTSTPGRRTRIQPSSPPGGAPSTTTYEVSLSVLPHPLTLSKKTHTHEADISAPERPHLRSPGRDIACSKPDSPQHHVLGQSNPTFQSYSIRILPTPGGYYIRSSEDLTLPPTCTSTRRDEPFVLFDGSTDRVPSNLEHG